MESAYEAIAIVVYDFSWAIQKPSLPVTDNLDFSCNQGVGAFSVPEVELPLSLIELSGRMVVIGAISVPLVVFECAHVDIAIQVVQLALERCGAVEVRSLKTFSAW